MKYPKSQCFLLVILFPPQKTKKHKSSPKQLTVLNPNLPIYLQLFWLVCAFFFVFPKSPGRVVFFRSVSCPFVQEAPSCPETAAGWPRSCTFLGVGPVGPRKTGQIFFPKKLRHKEMGCDFSTQENVNG